MEDNFKQVVTLAILLIVGVYLVGAVYGSVPASETTTVTNESVTINYSTSIQVSETYGETYFDNETVYNSSGAELTEGTDYEWYPDNQSLRFYSTTSTTEGNEANVTYSFDAKPGMARSAIGPISSSFALGAVAVIVAVAALILALVSGFGTSTRGRR